MAGGRATALIVSEPWPGPFVMNARRLSAAVLRGLLDIADDTALVDHDADVDAVLAHVARDRVIHGNQADPGKVRPAACAHLR